MKNIILLSLLLITSIAFSQTDPAYHSVKLKADSATIVHSAGYGQIFFNTQSNKFQGWNGTNTRNFLRAGDIITRSYGGVLPGGNTGQIPRKNSNSDYDWIWVTPSTAATNEFMKADATGNSVGAKWYNPSAGTYEIGDVSTSGNKTISAINTAGTAALTINAQTNLSITTALGGAFIFTGGVFVLNGNGTIGNLPLQIFSSKASTTATVVAGFGTDYEFKIQNGSGSVVSNAANIQIITTDPNNGTEDYDAVIKLKQNGSSGEKFRVTSDGRIYGTALHNNSGSLTGTTNQYVASGTYTPTLTNVTNVAASTAYACQWMRVGNVVTVSGQVDIDVTLAASTASELGISLPIASSLTADQQVGGDAISDSIASLSARIKADVTNDRASVVFKAISLTNDTYSFTFTYLIL